MQGTLKQCGSCHFQGFSLLAHNCNIVLERTGRWGKAAGVSPDDVCLGEPHSPPRKWLATGLPTSATPTPFLNTWSMTFFLCHTSSLQWLPSAYNRVPKFLCLALQVSQKSHLAPRPHHCTKLLFTFSLLPETCKCHPQGGWGSVGSILLFLGKLFSPLQGPLAHHPLHHLYHSQLLLPNLAPWLPCPLPILHTCHHLTE